MVQRRYRNTKVWYKVAFPTTYHLLVFRYKKTRGVFLGTKNTISNKMTYQTIGDVHGLMDIDVDVAEHVLSSVQARRAVALPGILESEGFFDALSCFAYSLISRPLLHRHTKLRQVDCIADALDGFLQHFRRQDRACLDVHGLERFLDDVFNGALTRGKRGGSRHLRDGRQSSGDSRSARGGSSAHDGISRKSARDGRSAHGGSRAHDGTSWKSARDGGSARGGRSARAGRSAHAGRSARARRRLVQSIAGQSIGRLVLVCSRREKPLHFLGALEHASKTVVFPSTYRHAAACCSVDLLFFVGYGRLKKREETRGQKSGKIGTQNCE